MKSAKFHYNISMTSRDVAKTKKKRNLLHSVVPLSRMLNVEHTAGESSVGLIWVIDRVESRESVSRWIGELLSSWAVGLLVRSLSVGNYTKDKRQGLSSRRLDATTRLDFLANFRRNVMCVNCVCAGETERERGRDWHSVEMKVKTSQRDKRSTAWNPKLKPKDETETET